MQIPIFVINLPKDKERLIFMENQINKLGLSYEIIKGFYGDDEKVIQNCDDQLAIKEHGKVLMKGEKGCAYSHRFIYEKMLKENIDCALILEDDAILPKNFSEILVKEIKRKNKNWDWLSFDYPRIGGVFILAWIVASKNETIKNKMFFFYALLKFIPIVILSIYELMRNFLANVIPSFAGPKIFYRPLYNAGAYLITQEGIEKMKPLLYPIRFSADRTPNQARVRTGLKMRWYVPLIVRQNDGKDGFVSNTIM